MSGFFVVQSQSLQLLTARNPKMGNETKNINASAPVHGSHDVPAPAANQIEIVIVDIEEHGKKNEAPPTGKQIHYRIRIDKAHFIVQVPGLVGRDILLLAGKKPPERFLLEQKLHGGQMKVIKLDEFVDFTKPGIERFVTLPLDQTDGHGQRRQFRLSETDEASLNLGGARWEAVVEGGSHWLIVHDLPVPTGFKQQRVTAALMIPAGYPDVQIDMAYFFPALARADGKAIPAIEVHNFDGKQWQRWSRHRTSANPWRPGEDDVRTHLVLVSHWLVREVGGTL